MIKFLAIVFAIVVLTTPYSQAFGAIYGPERGTCHAPADGKEIGPTDDLEKEISQFAAGRALVLSAGRYVTKGNITVPEGVSIVAKAVHGRCGNDVTIETTGTIVLPNRTELNGLNIIRETPCDKQCQDAVVIRIRNNAKRIRILNNRIWGSSGNRIQIASNAEDITIRGNDFLDGDSWMIGVRGNPTKDVLIEKNRFKNCGNDCIQAENHINLYIVDNEFYGGSKTVQIMDIKVGQGDSVVRNNLLDCRNVRSGCVLYHANDYEVPRDARAEFAGNKLLGCASRSMMIGGNKRYKYRNLIVRDNTFDSMGRACEIRLYKCIDCIIHNNEFIGGELKVEKEAEKGLIQANRFVRTRFTNRGGDVRCIGNRGTNTKGSICRGEESVSVVVPDVPLNRPSSSNTPNDAETD
jgi:hypothetical protein